MPGATRGPLPWDARFPGRHRALAALFGDLEPLPRAWPDPRALNALLARGGGTAVTAGGVPVRAVPGIALGGGDWERRLATTGEIPVRQGSWHDLFNLLAWRAFPRTKAAVNGAHLEALVHEAEGRRGPRRDALAAFDEDGLVVACEDDDLEALVRDFRWRELFVDHRDAACARLHALVFGHALCEKLLAPFKGITGKALFVAVPPGFGRLPPSEQRALADRIAAPQVAGLISPQALAPLPVLGLPGWWPGNEDPAFYDDPAVFRPGRRVRGADPG
ncbi:MAG: DUF3025 domain-containing protein [Betaproteobacteria bacterium]